MRVYNWSHPNPLISNLKSNKTMSKGLYCNIVSANELDHHIPSINSVPVVNEFLDVFPENLPGILPSERLILVWT